MTYCVAMRLASGMIFVSDSRTNAGVDHISTFKKLHIFHKSEDRTLMMQSAGNLATTQSVMSLMQHRAQDATTQNLYTVSSLYDAAVLVGQTLKEVIERDGSDFTATFTLGGQIRGEGMRLFHIYAEGNFIESTVDTPYFQIGESKYGKPIIDRIVSYDTELEQAVQCALISMDSTLNSNLSVGLPLDVMIYHKDSFDDAHQHVITAQHGYFNEIRTMWGSCLRSVFDRLPPLQLK